MKTIQILLLVTIVLSTGCSVTTKRVHPTLSEELQAIDSVVIAPPEVIINLIKFKGDNERLTDEEERYEAAIKEIAQRELEEANFDVIEFDFESAIEQDSEFAYLVKQIREDFDVARKDLNAGIAISQTKANEMRAQLGEAVNIVAERANADAVLITSYQGFKKSGGQVAKDVGSSVLVGVLTLGAVVPVQTTSGGFTEAALIDGTTGDVLWTDVRQGVLNENLTDLVMDSLPDDIDPVSSPKIQE